MVPLAVGADFGPPPSAAQVAASAAAGPSEAVLTSPISSSLPSADRASSSQSRQASQASQASQAAQVAQAAEAGHRELSPTQSLYRDDSALSRADSRLLAETQGLSDGEESNGSDGSDDDCVSDTEEEASPREHESVDLAQGVASRSLPEEPAYQSPPTGDSRSTSLSQRLQQRQQQQRRVSVLPRTRPSPSQSQSRPAQSRPSSSSVQPHELRMPSIGLTQLGFGCKDDQDEPQLPPSSLSMDSISSDVLDDDDDDESVGPSVEPESPVMVVPATPSVEVVRQPSASQVVPESPVRQRAPSDRGAVQGSRSASSSAPALASASASASAFASHTATEPAVYTTSSDLQQVASSSFASHLATPRALYTNTSELQQASDSFASHPAQSSRTVQQNWTGAESGEASGDEQPAPAQSEPLLSSLQFPSHSPNSLGPSDSESDGKPADEDDEATMPIAPEDAVWRPSAEKEEGEEEEEEEEEEDDDDDHDSSLADAVTQDVHNLSSQASSPAKASQPSPVYATDEHVLFKSEDGKVKVGFIEKVLGQQVRVRVYVRGLEFEMDVAEDKLPEEQELYELEDRETVHLTDIERKCHVYRSATHWKRGNKKEFFCTRRIKSRPRPKHRRQQPFETTLTFDEPMESQLANSQPHRPRPLARPLSFASAVDADDEESEEEEEEEPRPQPNKRKAEVIVVDDSSDEDVVMQPAEKPVEKKQREKVPWRARKRKPPSPVNTSGRAKKKAKPSTRKRRRRRRRRRSIESDSDSESEEEEEFDSDDSDDDSGSDASRPRRQRLRKRRKAIRSASPSSSESSDSESASASGSSPSSRSHDSLSIPPRRSPHRRAKAAARESLQSQDCDSSPSPPASPSSPPSPPPSPLPPPSPPRPRRSKRKAAAVKAPLLFGACEGSIHPDAVEGHVTLLHTGQNKKLFAELVDEAKSVGANVFHKLRFMYSVYNKHSPAGSPVHLQVHLRRSARRRRARRNRDAGGSSSSAAAAAAAAEAAADTDTAQVEASDIVVVVADKPRRSAKYLLALARGTAPVRMDWLQDCMAKKQLLPTIGYTLPRGQLRATGLKLSFGNRVLEPRHGLLPLPMDERVFANCVFAICWSHAKTSRKSKQQRAFCEEWSFVLQQAGVRAVHTTWRAIRKHASTINWTLIFPPARETLSKEEKRELPTPVSTDWVIECLVRQKVQPATIPQGDIVWTQ